MSIFRFPIRTTALLFLLAAGCIRVDLPEQQVRETHTYDLRPLPQEERGFPCGVEILPFFSDAPARYKMLHRKGTELRVEEYRKWGQSPAAMLTRLFRSAFVPSKVTEEEYRLSGTILQFEANEETNTADLTVKYVFFHSSERGSGFCPDIDGFGKTKGWLSGGVCRGHVACGPAPDPGNQTAHSTGDQAEMNREDSILIEEAAIRAKVAELGEQINRDYKDRELIMIAIANGAVVFAADLLRCLRLTVWFDTVTRDLVCGTVSGDLALKNTFNLDLSNRHILLVDDILDTSKTLCRIREHISLLLPRLPPDLCSAGQAQRTEQWIPRGLLRFFSFRTDSSSATVSMTTGDSAEIFHGLPPETEAAVSGIRFSRLTFSLPPLRPASFLRRTETEAMDQRFFSESTFAFASSRRCCTSG